MKKLTLSEEEVKQIAHRYIHGVDKYYRMFAGLSTELVGYRDGIIYIEISNDQSSILSTRNTAICFARSYRNFSKELKHMKGFVVIFFESDNSPGGHIFGEFSVDDLKSLAEGMQRTEKRLLHSIHADLFTREMERIEKDLVRKN